MVSGGDPPPQLVGAVPDSLGLEGVPPVHQEERVQVLMDNTTALCYCNKQGRVGSWVLCQEALCFCKSLNGRVISLVVQHLAGSLMSRVDELGRRCLVDQEWQLHS